LIDELGGKPVAHEWHSPRVERITKERGRNLRYTDFPWLAAHAPVFSRMAMQDLREYLERYGELLPLRATSGEDYYVLNVLETVDALDWSASEVQRFDDGRLMGISSYVFREDRVRDAHIFRLPVERSGWTYVTDAHVDRITSTALADPCFQPLWQSD